ncbi:MAG: hypothetical protein IME94_05225 [Proteobacteria bacterium]|nr:hypothetical protein [Pseudomonadota bacterium]
MEALILFGSQISGGANKNSDKDILIISSLKKRKKYTKKYTSQGYSVSFYSKEQVLYMKKKGSLFLQHLKIESKIIYDKDLIFSDFLKTCKLITPSAIEMNNCIESLKIAMLSPRNPLLHGWVADYIYVLSRDYFVKYFATKGELFFNVNKLCKKIEYEFKLTPEDSRLLLALREAKNIYRSRTVYLRMQWNIIERWVEILTKILKINKKQMLTPHTEISYLNLHFDYKFNSSYELLRYIESLKILFPKVKCNHSDEMLITKLIKNPNKYSSTSKRNRLYLETYLCEFKKKANQNMHVDSKKLGRKSLAKLF